MEMVLRDKGWWGAAWDPPTMCVSVAGERPALLGMGTGEDKYWPLACLWWFASLPGCNQKQCSP